MRFCLKSILIWMFFACNFHVLPAQEYYFRQYSRDDGLPQSTVRDIYQDQEGYVWLATDGGGVVRFDGHKMSHFSVRNGLADNAVSCIVQDRAGNIWLGGLRRGLSRFDGQVFHRYDESHGLSSKGIHAILELSPGVIWLGTAGGDILAGDIEGNFKPLQIQGLDKGHPILGIGRTPDQRIIILTKGMGCGFLSSDLKTYTIAPGVPSENVNCMAISPKGEMWIGTSHGVSIWNGTRFDSPPGLQSLSNQFITDIHWMSDGTQCIATYSDGLFLYDRGQLSHLQTSEGLTSPSLLSLTQDNEGNLWIGTYRGGVNLFLGKELSSINHKHGLCSDIIRAISEDTEGHIWFGTYQSGVCRYDGPQFTQFGVEQGMPSEMIQDILPLPTGEMLFGTLNGLAVKESKKLRTIKIEDGLSDNFIRCMALTPNQGLWVGTEDGGAALLTLDLPKASAKVVRTIEKVNGTSVGNIRWMSISRTGGLAIATSEGIIIEEKGKLSIIDRKSGLPESRINTVMHDPAGNIWAGCEGGGLVFLPADFLHQPDSFFLFDATNGMEEDNVLSLALDGDGNLWVVTESGVQVLNHRLFLEKRQIDFNRFDRNNGYTGHENLRNAIHVDRKGNVWIGTVRGAHLFRAGILDRQNKPPKVVLDDVQLFREKVDWVAKGLQLDSLSGLPQNLVLPYDQNHLTFEFTGIHFTNPARVEYRHRLVGFDREWSKPSNSPLVTYSNLAPGSYTFELQAAASQSDWERSPIQFSFSIRPPWYYTWWFITIAFIVVLGLVYAFVSYRTRSFRIFNTQLQAEIEQRKQTEAELIEANRDLDTLLYRTAHDLKAPVATALGMLDIASSETKDAQMLTYLQMIRLSNAKLNQTVENLLEITHIKAKKLAPEKINLREMAELAWKSLEKETDFTAVQFTNMAPVDTHAITDPALLKFVLVNLFGNAIHYRNRKAAQSTLTFNAEPLGVHWLLTIADNGIGMPKNIQEKAFQMFFRGSDQVDGTGLGLYVVKKGVTRLSGSISLESEQGKGTTFRIKMANLETNG